MSDDSSHENLLSEDDNRLSEYGEKIKSYRASFIENSATLEIQLEWIISSYFSKNFNDYSLFNHIVFSDTRLGFSDKITMFEKLGYVILEFKDDISDVVLMLHKIRRIRNDFAHGTVGMYEKDVTRIEKEILFIVVEKGENKQKSYTFEYVDSVMENFHKLNSRFAAVITDLKNSNSITQKSVNWVIKFSDE